VNRLIATLTLLVCLALPAAAQKHAIPPTLTHARVWAVDTLITDSKGVTRPAHSVGMLAFVCAYHKDAVHVLCEYVSKSASDFDQLKKDAGAHGDPKMFVLDKHKTKHSQLEAQAHAAGFNDVDLRRLLVVVR